MTESKNEFIMRRTPLHMDILRDRHEDIPENALEFWARDYAEREYRTGRVYADPCHVEMGEIHVYDPSSTFSSGRTQGLNIRFGPAGPMVSIIAQSYEEARELAKGLVRALRTAGEWTEEDADEMYSA